MKIEWKSAKNAKDCVVGYLYPSEGAAIRIAISYREQFKDYLWSAEENDFQWDTFGIAPTLVEAKRAAIVSIINRQEAIIGPAQDLRDSALDALECER